MNHFNVCHFRIWLKTNLRNTRHISANISKKELNQIRLRNFTRRSMLLFVLIQPHQNPPNRLPRRTRGLTHFVLLSKQILLKQKNSSWFRLIQVQFEEIDLRGKENQTYRKIECTKCQSMWWWWIRRGGWVKMMVHLLFFLFFTWIFFFLFFYALNSLFLCVLLEEYFDNLSHLSRGLKLNLFINYH